jgi:lipoprotein-anchoring transpeptidase ErfK/SrfK
MTQSSAGWLEGLASRLQNRRSGVDDAPEMTERATQPRRWRAGLLVGVLSSLALVPIAVGLLLSGGGAARAIPAAPAFTPVRQAKTPASKPRSNALPRNGALVALVGHSTTMYVRPGGPALAQVPIHTGFGSPQTMWVVSRSPGWLGVISTLAGNNRVGWIPQSSATLGVLTWQLKVSLGSRILSVVDGGRVVRRFKVAIGRPSAPTPTGRFAVTDRLLTGDPGGPYGCCILALSARSPHSIQGWSGGNRIAIHSTPETSSIGQPVSHGCVRVSLADGRWLIAHIPLGTPALIRG